MQPSLFRLLRHIFFPAIPLFAACSIHAQALQPWAETDLGNTGASGSAVYDPNNFFSVFGAGTDVWGTADAFHFVYQPVHGDFDFTSILNYVTYTDPWTKVGLMIRQSLDPASPNGFLFVTPANGLGFQWRTVPAGQTQWQSGGAGTAPIQVRLVRAGNTVSAYRPGVGNTWTLIGSATLNLDATAYVGMAVTSHRYGVRAEGQFDRPTFISGPGGGGQAPLAPSNLTATAVSPTQINLSWAWMQNSTNATWFELQRSTNATDFAPLRRDPADSGTTFYNDVSVSAGGTYYYRLRTTNEFGVSPWSNVAQASTPGTHGQLPSPWEGQNVGAAAGNGLATFSNGVFAVTGSGADIWGSYDNFYYAYKPVVGDLTILARLSAIQPADSWATELEPWAKAGLMLRNGVGSDAINLMVFATPQHGVGMQWRQTTGGVTYFISAAEFNFSQPVWLQLKRVDDLITAYWSYDGISWAAIGSVASALGPEVEAGMAVTSHNSGLRATGFFDNVQVSALPGGVGPPFAPTGLMATVISSNEINIVWNWRSNSNERTRFEMQRSTDGTVFQTFRTELAASGTTYYNDVGLIPDTHYWYRIRATNSLGISPWSNLADAITSAVGPELPWPWGGEPIGAMAGRGDAAHSNGVFIVTGNGTDIWGSYDNFYYVHHRVEGSFHIVARVTSMAPADASSAPLEPWAKAGLMIRNFLPPDTANVMVFVSPQHGIGMQWRSGIGDVTKYVAGPEFTFSPASPIWLKLSRTFHTYSGFWSLDGQDWRFIGAIQMVTPEAMEAGMALTSHRYGARMTATYANVSVSTNSIGGGGDNPLPAPWQNQDIGPVGIAGQATYDADTFTVNGSGADIWGSEDAFHYVYQPWTGDGQITARVRRLNNQLSPNGWAKTGVMFRQSTAANSQNVFLLTSPDNGTAFQSRATAGGNTTYRSGPWSTEGWARIVRSGNVFTAYWSNDRVSWTTVGSYTVAMSDQVLVGLAVTSHNNAAVLTSAFSEVVVSP